MLVERVPDFSHEGVELKVPPMELGAVFRLPFDETDTEYVGVNNEWLGRPKVGNTSSRDADLEDRIRNLTSRLLGESMVTTCYPFVLGVRVYGLIM